MTAYTVHAAGVLGEWGRVVRHELLTLGVEEAGEAELGVEAEAGVGAADAQTADLPAAAQVAPDLGTGGLTGFSGLSSGGAIEAGRGSRRLLAGIRLVGGEVGRHCEAGMGAEG